MRELSICEFQKISGGRSFSVSVGSGYFVPAPIVFCEPVTIVEDVYSTEPVYDRYGYYVGERTVVDTYVYEECQPIYY